MLRALLGAQREAMLQAGISPSPSGSLPRIPLSTEPSSPGSKVCLSAPGVAVIQKGQEPPLHLPHDDGGGDKRRRQASQKPHVGFWREMLAYIDAAYLKKFGRHYPWSNLARKNLWYLARVHSAAGVMALFDLYLESNSWWAKQTAWSVYGIIRDTGRLMDDRRLKQLAFVHEESLAQDRYGKQVKTSDVFNSLFSDDPRKLKMALTYTR
jgi:hypothetical protein